MQCRKQTQYLEERIPPTTPATTEKSGRLPVSPQGQGVVTLPGLSATGLGLVVATTLVETTGLLAGGGEATGLAVLVDGVDDPVDAGIDADGLVLGVDKDNLVVLVGRVLVDPVGVEDSEVGAAAADTLLSGGLEGSLVLELVHTLVGGLAISGTLGNRALAATTANTDAVDDIALLGLVSETASLVEAGRARGAVDDGQLTEFPAAHSGEEAHDIRLLLLLKLFDVLEGTHLCGLCGEVQCRDIVLI